MASGEETSRSITQKYLDRIAQRDGRVRSVLETNPDALAQADALDRERKAGKLRGPLHGIPVLLKDNIATRDRMHTTAGSLALMDATVPADAFLVGKLREAGAVLLGKTQLSEWANLRSSHSSSGWSGRGGQCRNAYALDRSPSGSSSGSGVAVSVEPLRVAVGTETDGSIVSPSAVSALVGVKPTVGLVSRSGIVPISHSQDTAGPMAGRCATPRCCWRCSPGATRPTPATVAKGARFDVRYSAALDRGALKGARIGVPRTEVLRLPPGDRCAGRGGAELLKAEGAILVDPATIATAGKFDDPELEVLLYEFKADLKRTCRSSGGPGPRTMKALIEWNQAHAAEEMPLFGQELFIDAEKKGPLTTPAYRKAREACIRLSRKEGIDAVMGKHRLDALVAPTPGAGVAHRLGERRLLDSGGCSTPAAVAGYPHVTVPMGQVRGLPVGLSFFGRAWSESRLLALAYAYEQASHARKPPTFAASAVFPAV